MQECPVSCLWIQMEKKYLYQPTTYHSITHYESRSFTMETKGEHRKDLTPIVRMAQRRLKAVGITDLKELLVERVEDEIV